MIWCAARYIKGEIQKVVRLLPTLDGLTCYSNVPSPWILVMSRYFYSNLVARVGPVPIYIIMLQDICINVIPSALWSRLKYIYSPSRFYAETLEVALHVSQELINST
jgi:hypothetical protein